MWVKISLSSRLQSPCVKVVLGQYPFATHFHFHLGQNDIILPSALPSCFGVVEMLNNFVHVYKTARTKVKSVIAAMESKTNRGTSCIIYENNKFTLHYEGKHRVTWRCTNKKCKSKLFTKKGDTKSITMNHIDSHSLIRWTWKQLTTTPCYQLYMNVQNCNHFRDILSLHTSPRRRDFHLNFGPVSQLSSDWIHQPQLTAVSRIIDISRTTSVLHTPMCTSSLWYY